VVGETIFSGTMPVSELIGWSPAIALGEYILNVQTKWKQGEVPYWLNVKLE